MVKKRSNVILIDIMEGEYYYNFTLNKFIPSKKINNNNLWKIITII